MKYSEEELKAIEYFENKIKYYENKIEELKQEGKPEGYGTEIDTYKLRICNTQILLNLIEKQQDETKSARKDSDKWFKKLQEVQKKENSEKKKLNEIIDNLIVCLAEEQGVEEDEIRRQFEQELDISEENEELEEKNFCEDCEKEMVEEAIYLISKVNDADYLSIKKELKYVTCIFDAVNVIKKYIKKLEDRELWATSSIYGFKKDFVPKQVIINARQELKEKFEKFSKGIINKKRNKKYLQVRMCYEAMMKVFQKILK